MSQQDILTDRDDLDGGQGRPPAVGMAWVPAGTFRLGSDDFYPEERPTHKVTVDGFWIDQHLVTAAEFRRFVRETGHVTVAERSPDPAQYPDADPALLRPGSLVFRKPPGRVGLDDVRDWWEYLPGATWKRPGGKGTTRRSPGVTTTSPAGSRPRTSGRGSSPGRT
jgi:sulfatase modifying factor 1